MVVTAGLLGFAAAQVLFIRLPATGSFTTDLLPGFLVVVAALGLAFVGEVIASATDVRPGDMGLASGLINTSQQIGGAIGLAVTTTVAAARAAALLRTGHTAAAALTAGFHDAFAITAGLALAAAAAAAIFIRRAKHGRPGPGRSLTARDRGYLRLSLKTGSQPAFAPARSLYASAGFTRCGPFSSYRPSRSSTFMTQSLDGPAAVAPPWPTAGSGGSCHGCSARQA